MFRLLLVCAFLAYSSLGFATTPPGELNQAELVKVANKELIIHSKEVAKCPWPELTVFALIDVSPAEAAALFSKYEDQKKYIPDLV